MITELTEEQKKMIPVYVEKWAKIGLSTEPVKDYEETINLFYEKVLNKKGLAEIVLSPSPLQAWQQIWDPVKSQVFEQVYREVKNQVRDQIWDQIWEKIWEKISKKKYRNYPFFDHSDVAFFAFYDYLNEVLNIQYSETWFIYKRITELGFIIIFDNSGIVLDKPEQISTSNGVLHNEKGMAIKYKDGRGVYILNGVRVTKEIVETPADKLEPEIILKETNVAVKLEIVKKIKADKLDMKNFLKEYSAEVRLEIVRKIGADKLDPEIFLKETNEKIKHEVVRKIGAEKIVEKIGIDKLSSELLLKESNAGIRLEIVRRIEADKLEPEIILKERNAEIRREIVRKIGIERLEKKLKPNVLDKWGDYELHDYSNHFRRMRCRPVYLKMKNPSIGVWHYEGVNIDEMEAPTCQAALKWRLKGKDFKPIRIT